MQEQERANPAVALLHERIAGNLRLIGLTGGIASGKSTVSRCLEEAGIPVIDADEIARHVVKPGHKAYTEVVNRFGRWVLGEEGEIDRARLGALVFEDEKARKDLEAITHPEIVREIARRIRDFEKKPGLIVIDAALLFESGLSQSMDRNILVTASPEVQLKRLMDRDGLTEAEARRRIEAQMPSEEKLKRADFVIDNSGTPEEAQRQVLAVLQEILMGVQ